MKHFTDEGAFLVTAQVPVQWGASIYSLGIFNTEKRALDFINDFMEEQNKISLKDRSIHGFTSSIVYKDLKITNLKINPPINSKKIKDKSFGNLLLKVQE